jgi:predicted DCC family thiol-disulfide oxidoreductase YuxK
VARVVATLDRREELAFLGFGDERAEEVLAGLAEDERHSTWRLALPDGRVVGYGSGFVHLLRALRLTQPLAHVLERIPDRALDRAYGVIASRRPQLGHFVPDRPGPVRFP